MIAEFGHYALVLAFALSLAQSVLPMVGASAASGPGCRSRGRRPSRSSASSALPSWRWSSASSAPISRSRRSTVFAFPAAADLQDRRDLGQSRGLAAALGADPRDLRRAGRPVRREPAAAAQGPRAVGAGHDRLRLPRLHAVHLQSVRAPLAGAAGGRRSSIRCCRIPASPCIRRCSISAMSASR